MKKIITFLICLIPWLSFASEPLMLVKPSREIFINFPSAILPDKAVSVFLPEPSIPLHQKYPVVYILGAVPTDAPQAQEVLARSEQKALLVGLNVEEVDLSNPEKMVYFFQRELIPYIDTNYLTKDEPQSRVVAVQGAAGAKVAVALLNKHLVQGAVILNGGNAVSFLTEQKPDVRMLLAGKQAELAAWSNYLQEEKKLVYGAGFVAQLTEVKSVFDTLNLDYLFAPAGEVELVKLSSTIIPSSISISASEVATLQVSALLANGMRFDFIPFTFKQSPPFLNWDSAQAKLTIIPGATAGKVKISAFVDNTPLTGVIRLKK